MRGFMFFLVVLCWHLPALAQIGELTALQGAATVLRQGQSLSLSLNDPLYQQDTVETAADASARITLSDGSSLDLGPDTRVVLADYRIATPQGEVGLERGGLWLQIGDTFSRRRNAFRVRTNHGVAGVQGTEFGVETSAAQSLFRVRSGQVEVVILVNGQRRVLGSGESLVITAAGEFQTPSARSAPTGYADPDAFAGRAVSSEVARASGEQICAPALDLDRLSEEVLKPMFPRPGEPLALSGLVVGRGVADCVCAEPSAVALTALEIGQTLHRHIGDARAVGGLVCRQGRVKPVSIKLDVLDDCVGDAGIDVLAEEIAADLSAWGESGAVISAIKLGSGCVCQADRRIDRILQVVDSRLLDEEESQLGFARVGIDLLAAGCRPEYAIENTDERIVDPASPSR